WQTGGLVSATTTLHRAGKRALPAPYTLQATALGKYRWRTSIRLCQRCEGISPRLALPSRRRIRRAVIPPTLSLVSDLRRRVALRRLFSAVPVHTRGLERLSRLLHQSSATPITIRGAHNKISGSIFTRGTLRRRTCPQQCQAKRDEELPPNHNAKLDQTHGMNPT